MSRLPGETLRKNYFIFFSSYCSLHIYLSYCPLQIWTWKLCNKDISKTITASILRFSQLIEDGE